MRSLHQARNLFWPVLALVLLLVLNVIATPDFFSIRVQDGHLYGSLIDILRNGAPTLLIALGMTLVIATRGIDLSVGAIVAISGAVACTYMAGSPDESTAGRAIVAHDHGRGASASCWACGTASWSRCWGSSRSSRPWC